jgi:YD repeat-containing protein
MPPYTLLRCLGPAALLITLASPASAVIKYQYDELDRLTLVTYDDGTQVQYEYDAAGNRTQRAVTEDRDGDGIPFAGGSLPCVGGQKVDCEDNCPGISNPSQEDRGGVGFGSAPDGIGDACQCGDVDGDGSVTTADALMIRRALLVPPTATILHPELCDVIGASDCSSADALAIRRALLAPPTATINQQCEAARR